jgi:hypothetical protein
MAMGVPLRCMARRVVSVTFLRPSAGGWPRGEWDECRAPATARARAKGRGLALGDGEGSGEGSGQRPALGPRASPLQAMAIYKRLEWWWGNRGVSGMGTGGDVARKMRTVERPGARIREMGKGIHLSARVDRRRAYIFHGGIGFARVAFGMGARRGFGGELPRSAGTCSALVIVSVAMYLPPLPKPHPKPRKVTPTTAEITRK